MRIQWLGRERGRLPVVEMPEDAQPLNVAGSAATWLIVPLLGVGVACFFVKRATTGLAIDPTWLFVGVLAALALTMPHELLHAVCYPKEATVGIFYTMAGLGTTCTAPLSRGRFLWMNACPMLVLGVAPMVAWLFLPAGWVALNSALFAVWLFHIGASYVDAYSILNALRKVPKGAMVRVSGDQFYWYPGRLGSAVNA